MVEKSYEWIDKVINNINSEFDKLINESKKVKKSRMVIEESTYSEVVDEENSNSQNDNLENDSVGGEWLFFEEKNSSEMLEFDIIESLSDDEYEEIVFEDNFTFN